MDDLTQFEARLARGVVVYTERALRPYDPATVTEAAAGADRPRWIAWSLAPSTAWLRVAVLALLVALIAGTALLVGGRPWILDGAPSIVFARDRSIFVLDPKTGDERTLGIADDPVWSPDHTRIAMGRGDEQVVFDLSDDSEVVLGPWFGPVAWSPDGSSVLAAYRTGPFDENDNPASEFTILPADGGAPQGLGIAPWSDAGNGAWSPDGERVAVVTNGNVVVVAVEGRGTTLLHEGGSPRLVGWSSTANLVAFADDRGIWVVDPDTGAERLVLDQGGFVRSLEWSPDGTKLAYVDEATEPAWLLDVGTGATTELLAPPEEKKARAVTWSPAGDAVLITVGSISEVTDMTASLWIVSADGARVRLLVQPAAYEPYWSHPDW